MEKSFKNIANTYEITDYYWKTVIRVYKDENWKYCKIHIQNYKISDFAKDLKIEYKYWYYYKLTSKILYCQNFDTILDDIEKDINWEGVGVWSLVLHKILDDMKTK